MLKLGGVTKFKMLFLLLVFVFNFDVFKFFFGEGSIKKFFHLLFVKIQIISRVKFFLISIRHYLIFHTYFSNKVQLRGSITKVRSSEGFISGTEFPSSMQPFFTHKPVQYIF